MFLYKNLFFSISSILSIPIMLIGIKGGYFPAICRLCFSISGSSLSQGCGSSRAVLSTVSCCVKSVAISQTTDSCPVYLYTSQMFSTSTYHPMDSSVHCLGCVAGSQPRFLLTSLTGFEVRTCSQQQL